jgi:hypothetical protein
MTGLFLGNDGVNYSWMTIPNQVPSIVGQSGKYLTNNGSTVSWTPYNGLPTLSGMSGKILTTDGATAFWVDPTSLSGGGGLTRLPIVVTTASLAVLADTIMTVNTTCKTFQVQSIVASCACRVRIYANYAAAVADQARLIIVDPTGNHQMYLEMAIPSSLLTWTCSPVPTCPNQDTVIGTNTYITIQNMDVIPQVVTLTLNLMKME